MERKLSKRDIPLVLLFLIPGLLIFTFVIIIPTGFAISYSLYEASSFVGIPTFVGLENYLNILSDTRFWRDLWQTLVYALGSIFLQIIMGIVIALILNQQFKGRDFVRGVSVVPYIIPVIVVTMGWEWILDTNFGIINKTLASIGVGNINFLSMDLAMLTSILLSVWTWTPFVTLVFLSGLQTISHDLYESATLDGADGWQQFWRITIPMMKDLLITIVLLRGLWMFNKFDLVWLLTGGGPLEKTETLPIYIYLKTFKLNEVGYGAAVAVTSAVIMMVIMFVYLKITNYSPKKLKKRAAVQEQVSAINQGISIKGDSSL